MGSSALGESRPDVRKPRRPAAPESSKRRSPLARPGGLARSSRVGLPLRSMAEGRIAASARPPMTLLPSRPLVVLALCALPAIAGCPASASFQAGGAAQPEAPPPPPPPPPPAPAEPAPAATTPATEAPPAKANTPPARQSKATVRGDVVMLPAAVEFEPGTTTLRAGSEAPLEQLRLFLVENPRVTKLRIEGHTDNTGDAANNEKLSGERALALKKWLVDRGIQKERLIAV